MPKKSNNKSNPYLTCKMLYALRDDKAAVFNSPVVITNDAVAIRQFGDAIKAAKDSPLGQHPEDFSIWFIGYFDEITGSLIPGAENFRVLARGNDFLDKE